MWEPPSQPWRSYVAGEWTAAPDARRYEISDPGRTSQTVAQYLLASTADAERAVAAAKEAASGWAATSAQERSDLVYGLIDIWRENIESVAQSVTGEMGKPLSESRSEAQRAVSEMRFWAGEALRLGDRTFPASVRTPTSTRSGSPSAPSPASRRGTSRS